MGYQYRSKYVGKEIDEVIRKVHEHDLDWNDLNTSTQDKIEGMINAAIQKLITFTERSQFPSIGEVNVLYMALDEEVLYFWKDNNYVQIGDRLRDVTLIDCGGAIV